MQEAVVVIEILSRRGQTLAVAESFTGGRILDALTDVPGASRVLRGGLVPYDNHWKVHHLDVREGDLVVHGAVSEEVAIAMAQGVRRRFETDYGLATTGIAGPTGATAAKPMGLSLVAVASTRRARADRRVHNGNRTDVKARAAQQTLRLLLEELRELAPKESFKRKSPSSARGVPHP